MIGLASPNPAPQSEQKQQTKQSLLLDALRRVEMHSPVWMLPRLITTLNLHKHLAQARQRLCDAHKHQHNLMGEKVDDCDDGGGISVQGDTTINNHGLRSLGMVAAVLLAFLIGALLAALLCRHFGAASSTANVNLGGVGQPATSTTPTTANWRLGIRVSDTP